MKTFAFKLMVVLYFFPCLLIGAMLSVVFLPVIIGLIGANDILDAIDRKLDKDIKDKGKE